MDVPCSPLLEPAGDSCDPPSNAADPLIPGEDRGQLINATVCEVINEFDDGAVLVRTTYGVRDFAGMAVPVTFPRRYMQGDLLVIRSRWGKYCV